MSYLAGVNRTVDTGDTYFREIRELDIAAKTDAVNRLNRHRLQITPLSNEQPLKARIEHARYIVDCPNCNGAEFAFEDKLFFCTICHNSDIKGKTRTVEMPKSRKGIEAALSKRKIVNRHWNPGETVKSLEDENAKMGVK